MKNKKGWKLGLIIGVSVVGGLILLAVLIGVLNATVAKGTWSLGWTNYRYDETGYEIGDGTIPQEGIKALEIDWIDGEIEILVCEDAYPSITETSKDELPESARLRWMIDDMGTLHIKYRESSYYFSGNARKKKLTVRLPAVLAENLSQIDLSVVSSNVMIKNMSAERLELESVSGNFIAEECRFGELDAELVSGAFVCNSPVTRSFDVETTSGTVLLMSDVCPAQINVESVSGEVKLTLPETTGMTLSFETVSGRFINGLGLSQSGNRFVSGDGSVPIRVETTSGDLFLEKK